MPALVRPLSSITAIILRVAAHAHRALAEIPSWERHLTACRPDQHPQIPPVLGEDALLTHGRLSGCLGRSATPGGRADLHVDAVGDQGLTAGELLQDIFPLCLRQKWAGGRPSPNGFAAGGHRLT